MHTVEKASLTWIEYGNQSDRVYPLPW